MSTRLAGCLSLLCFAICLVAGAFGADNAFETVVWRALVGMAVTFVVGLVIGTMAQKMIEENLSGETQRLIEARQARIKALEEREPILEVGSDEPG